ncbi:hypothetical protein ABC383_07855 [Noviherbaspirillum sp. 1P10PC]|uniref:hypothetical protein n=1 Tax=Noviherbaspirillum sp. 1P10PC TaxID=3132292 RepID=UPI0039A09513
MSTLKELDRIRTQLGLAPADGLIYLGLGFRPPKLNAIAIDPANLPTDRECYAVAGLDVVLVYRGDSVRYGLLRKLTASLYQALPRRLMIVDLDYSRSAFLKTVGTSWKL